jgi:hypothetical protein
MTQPNPSGIDRGRWRFSAAALIASNAIPLIGVMFFHWDLFTIIVSYWMENVVVGGYNILRMATARGGLGPARTSGGGSMSRTGMILFFMVHYGIFTMAHGAFVFAMFGLSDLARDPNGFLFGAVEMGRRLALMFIALTISHGVSYASNYLGNKEYLTAKVSDLLLRPYSRVAVMHLTIILGAFLALVTHSPKAVVAMLVALKIAVDLGAHWRERLRFAQNAAGAGSAAAPLP